MTNTQCSYNMFAVCVTVCLCMVHFCAIDRSVDLAGFM